MTTTTTEKVSAVYRLVGAIRDINEDQDSENCILVGGYIPRDLLESALREHAEMRAFIQEVCEPKTLFTLESLVKRASQILWGVQ